MAINVTLKDTSGNEEKVLYPQTNWGIIADKPSWLTTAESNGGITINSLTTNLSAADKQTIRTNIGAGTSSFSGNYTDLNYNINSISVTSNGQTVSLDATKPLNIVTIGGNYNIGAVQLSGTLPSGHSCHAIFYNSHSSDHTITIGYQATNRITPDKQNMSLTAKASGGYAEVDFLNINDSIYVRGI